MLKGFFFSYIQNMAMEELGAEEKTKSTGAGAADAASAQLNQKATYINFERFQLKCECWEPAYCQLLLIMSISATVSYFRFLAIFWPLILKSFSHQEFYKW